MKILENKLQIKIRNAKHVGEHLIKINVNKRPIRVDGYHFRSNTVFEFYGDCFHGNPKLYKPRQKCHPFSTKNAEKLFLETKLREKQIKKLGYKVISIWEHDYYNNFDRWWNRNLPKINKYLMGYRDNFN